MKYAWIDAPRREYSLPDMCEVLAVNSSGYRAWRRGGTPDSPKATTDSKHSMPVANNPLARNFAPEAPNRMWTGDSSSIATGAWRHLPQRSG